MEIKLRRPEPPHARRKISSTTLPRAKEEAQAQTIPRHAMRPALRLAASLAPGAASLAPGAARARAGDPAALTPPLALLRRVLRAHRSLPPEQRTLGDAYVKEEFRRHREVENPMHSVRPPWVD